MNLQISKDYRPDIDGLRALAVLIIVFFHAGFSWATGGFVGVDVFFVISGYLITRNIIYEIEKGTFSFSAFYIRRIRRLFPALFFTASLVLIMGYLFFSASDFERLGHSLLYAILSVSNFFFWNETGYFNAASEFKPLLHTWSLSIEEQFYLIWPALLLILYFIRKRYVAIAFFIAAIISSLYLSSIFMEKQPEAVFFLLPFRIFEFSIGALCVWLNLIRPKNRFIKESLTVIGLGCILWSTLAFSDRTIFPGYSALLPCIGAALIIYSGRSSLSNIFLSNRPAVKIGLISYSVYLVHWPIIVFYKYWIFRPISNLESILLIFASFILGYLMWKFIEQPFRFKKGSGNSGRLLLWFALPASILLFISANVWMHRGWPSRFPPEYSMSQEELVANRERYFNGVRQNDNNFLKGERNYKKVIVMGNSHSIDLIYALKENGSKLNITHLGTSYLCYNFGTPIKAKNKKFCYNKLRKNLADKHWATADAVYLHDHWPLLNAKDLEKRLKEIREITDAPIYVFGPKMIYRKPIPQIVSSHLRMSSINQYSKKLEKKERIITNKAIKKVIESEKIKDLFFVDVLKTQCGDSYENCNIVSPSNYKFLYFDYGHFTLEGAKEFGEKLKIRYPNIF